MILEDKMISEMTQEDLEMNIRKLTHQLLKITFGIKPIPEEKMNLDKVI